MSTASTPRPPRRGSRRPASVLFNTEAVVGIHHSNTTAEGRTRNEMPIQVSFCLKRRPQPSILYVHSSDLNPHVAPRILYSVDDLLLLRVNMGRGPFALRGEDYDYFVYRANSRGRRPSLELLRRPHPYLGRFSVGLLPLPDDRYIVAALNFTGIADQYELHLFNSDTWAWRSRTMPVKAPQEDFPVEIPDRLLHHDTTTVITIGDEGGTMGWVDLWRGILLCNVLDPEPSLRGVPLPLPLAEMSYNNGWLGMEFGNPAQRRGIAFIRSKKCLKFVHLQITEQCLPEIDAVTGIPSVKVDDWVLTTWSNKEMSSSLKDWHQESVVQASKITISPEISHVLEKAGLLRDNEAAAQCQNLQNLSIYQPSPCISGEGVVYLVAREKFCYPEAWILAVDMKNEGRLHSAAYFGIRNYGRLDVIYYPSRISKYMNPATTPVGKDAEESHGNGVMELIMIPETLTGGKDAEESHGDGVVELTMPEMVYGN